MTIIFSIGDCNGIGLEVFAKAIPQISVSADVHLVLAGNPETIAEYFEKAALSVRLSGTSLEIAEKSVEILPCGDYSPVEFGSLRASAGALSLTAIHRAISECSAGRADAMITLPVSKQAMALAGGTHPGQTELIAERCGVAQAMMILCHESVRVGLVTIHTPLAAVPPMISTERVFEHIATLAQSVRRDFGIDFPRIAVLGLNPHAGEGGNIGHEEMTAIQPAIEMARQRGILAEGAFPADGFFAHGDYRRFDGILAMYHDQGLIPLKLLASGAGVNFSAGLPIVRTSPDHGTAFGIAGQGIAEERSTLEAIRTALHIVRARQKKMPEYL